MSIKPVIISIVNPGPTALASNMMQVNLCLDHLNPNVRVHRVAQALGRPALSPPSGRFLEGLCCQPDWQSCNLYGDLCQFIYGNIGRFGDQLVTRCLYVIANQVSIRYCEIA